MVIKELIEHLNKYPPEMRVLGRGYESGYEDIDDVMVLSVCHLPSNPWYEGKYQSDYYGDPANKPDFTDCLTLS